MAHTSHVHRGSNTWALLDRLDEWKEVELALFRPGRPSVSYHELSTGASFTSSQSTPPFFSGSVHFLFISNNCVTFDYRLFLPCPTISSQLGIYLLLLFSPTFWNKLPDSINSSSLISLAPPLCSPWLLPSPQLGSNFEGHHTMDIVPQIYLCSNPVSVFVSVVLFKEAWRTLY